ncbi:methyl-accepting chemotaxis protein [Planosporangium mesophilum]|uniref:Methyl-accepting chemotaxis protein n=2 Tax=Planosporangium mesophilum TaxID=689768 RepID=A0A8J3X0C0_9ACTN|nr:methyl-accepting chemotaxis protein [Planosporangium mesophilum]GII23225.1 hypothetical protein Pme01_28220 [Planosporangium mesophilum]
MSGTGDGAGRRNVVSRWFADRTVRTKIISLFVTLAVVALPSCGVIVTSMANLSGAASDLYNTGVAQTARVGEIRQSYSQLGADVTNIWTPAPGSKEFDATVAGLQAGDAAVDQALAKYTSGVTTGREQAVAKFKADLVSYRQIRDQQVIPSLRAGDAGKARDVWSTTFAAANKAIADDLDALGAIEKNLAGVRHAEAKAAYTSALTTLATVLVLGLGLCFALALYVARLIVGTVRKVSYVAEGLAAGDLTRSSDVDDRDELGQMARSLDAATNNLREAIGTVAANSQRLASSSEDMSGVSARIAASAEESSTQAGLVSAAAGQVSGNVSTVATSAEEMGASIREIAHNATEAARVAAGAVSGAETATATVARLGESSVEIGNVVKVITSIAEQTNLLALNATIEAARAGEAGKGFAVVATEVKDLAEETAKATEDISRRVQAIQADSTAAVEAIAHIAEVIREINGFQATIASAVEEQTVTTNEMSRSVAEAATGATDIASNITGVASAAHTTSEGVNDARRTADELARMSGELQQLVRRFTI